MPRYDGTGPNSRGPFTGRGMGYCVEPIPAKPVKPVAVPVRPFYGKGRGRGRGRGWGRGRGRY